MYGRLRRFGDDDNNDASTIYDLDDSYPGSALGMVPIDDMPGGDFLISDGATDSGGNAAPASVTWAQQYVDDFNNGLLTDTPPAQTPATPVPVGLPPMTTRAPFNWTPVLFAGGFAIVGLLARGRSARRR